MSAPARPLDAPETPPRHARAFLIVVGLAALHAWAVWGYSGIFWGDHGRWLGTVARFAAGEMPYRDFSYTNPPFAIFLVGGLARLFGSTFAAITAIMTGLYLVVVSVFVLSLRRLVPDLVLPIALPSLLFAISFAFRHGVSLPAGTDSPASPVGFLCLLGAAWFIFEAVEAPGTGKAVGAGMLLALATLTRHDFWPATAYLLIAGGIFLSRRQAAARVQAAMALSFFAVVLTGAVLVVAGAGWPSAGHAFVSWDRAIESVLLGMPSLERLVVEIAGAAALTLTAITALWLCLAVDDRTATRWAGAMLLLFLTAAAVHLGTSVSIVQDLQEAGLPDLPTLTQDALWHEMQAGRGMIASALALFDARLQAHLFPVILPPIVLLVLIARWKSWHDPVLRGRLALLLGLCITARVRRGFGGADWYNVMLELPAYALFFQLICGPARQKAGRAVRAALSVLIVIGLYSYVSLGVGPLTFQGRNQRTVTRNGIVRWPPGAAMAYQTADRLLQAADPEGNRPVFAFGASGGWNFFLARPNALPWSDGLPSADSLVRERAAGALRRSRSLLIDNRYALRQTLGAATLLAWEPQSAPNRFVKQDRQWFEGMTRRCAPVGDADSTVAIAVFDCGRALR